jgi:hypothetical protein
MVTYEQSGKRWVVRRVDGSLLKNDKGNTKYYRLEEMAKMFADNVTEREKNPRPPSWRDVVREVRARTLHP